MFDIGPHQAQKDGIDADIQEAPDEGGALGRWSKGAPTVNVVDAVSVTIIRLQMRRDALPGPGPAVADGHMSIYDEIRAERGRQLAKWGEQNHPDGTDSSVWSAVADVARRAAGILAVRAQEKRITIAAPDADASQPAIAEFRRVLQVLLNLVGNAIRYSPEGSTIRIELGSSGSKARVSVTDEGPGLDQQAQQIVFDKFERLGRSGGGGSGLGLYISKRLAQAMGGDLAVDSTPGNGATFTLTVPAGN